MSDEKKSGEGKIAHLINKANKRKKDPEKPAEDVSYSDDDLELDVQDPTREQDTPPELTEVVDPGGDFELDEEDGKKGSFIGNMSLKQRILLVALVGAVVVGVSKSLSGGEGLDYLDESGQTTSAPVAESSTNLEAGPGSASPSSTDSDGLEPINQGNIAPDPNALNLTGNPDSATQVASTAFSVDPLNESESSSDIPPPSPEPEDEINAAPAEGEAINNEAVADKDSTSSDSFASAAFDSPGNSGSTSSQDDFMPPQSFGESTSAGGDVEGLKADIEALNSEVTSLSQSVVSIREEVSSTASSNRQLVNEVTKLMAALEKREKQVKQLRSRPDIRDLVIFRAASNCDACVPHAFFTWGDKEVEVGDGLQWQGYNVAIRGDRMTLRNDTDVYHYWYR